MTKILLLLLLIFGALVLFLNTSIAKKQISDYLSVSASGALGESVRIEAKSLSLSPTHIDATLQIDEKIDLQVSGYRSLFGAFDITYQLLSISGDKSDMQGRFLGSVDTFTLEGSGLLLGGEGDFFLRREGEAYHDISIDMKKIACDKALLLLKQKPLVAGVCSLQAEVPLWSDLEKTGEVNATLHRGGVYLRNVLERFALRLPDTIMIAGRGHLKLHNSGVHDFDANLSSNMGQFELFEGAYREVDRGLKAQYRLDIQELSDWQQLTKKRYSGAIETVGELAYHDRLKIVGASDSLGGELRYRYDDGALEAHMQALSLSKMLHFFSYPAFMQGEIGGTGSYLFKNATGVFNLSGEHTGFKDASVTRRIAKSTGINLAKEDFATTGFSATLQDSIVAYDLEFLTEEGGFLRLYDAKMDATRNSIDAKFGLSLQDAEYYGSLTGSVDAPKVDLDLGRLLEFKAKQEMDAFFGAGTSQKLKSLDANKVKSFIKSFF